MAAKRCPMTRAALIAVMLLLLGTGSAAAVQCQTSGKAWRLIDGRKCWFEGTRYLPKSALHWGSAAQVVKAKRPRKFRSAARVAEPAHHGQPKRRGDSGSDQVKQGGTAVDLDSQGRHGPHFSPSPEQFAAALQARAEELRVDLTKPKSVRTVLINPSELREPEQPSADDVPLPMPRPISAPQPRPALLTWLPLLLMLLLLLLLGNAASENEAVRGTKASRGL
jgi:hypothetical protein